MKIGYMRTSTGNQRKAETIQIQKQAIENKHTIDKWFMDDGISGASDIEDRQGLAELLNYIEQNKVDEIIIYKLDRLARDIGLQEYLIRLFSKQGVKLISINDKDISGDPQRKMLRVILGAVAEYEKELIYLRMSAGRMKKARAGQFAGGGVAYGYRLKDKELVIDETEAKNIRSIRYMRNRKRLSFQQICDALTKKGVFARNGKAFAKETIRQILNNKLNKGQYKYSNITAKVEHLTI